MQQKANFYKTYLRHIKQHKTIKHQYHIIVIHVRNLAFTIVLCVLVLTIQCIFSEF